jgi:hypothetical protein
MVTDDGLKYLENVHELCLGDFSEITDNGLKYLENVHELCLGDFSEITDNGLKYLKNMKTLIFCDDIKITIDGLLYLKKYANLNTIYIKNYPSQQFLVHLLCVGRERLSCRNTYFMFIFKKN